MLIEEVEKLINEGKIVACNLSDLRSVNIDEKDAKSKKKEFVIYAKKIEIIDFKDCVTFLYKMDDEHYIEYYSGIVITAIKNYKLEKIENYETLSKFEEKYKNNYESNPLVILRSDLRCVDGQEKEKFKNNGFDDLVIKIFLENRQELAKIILQQQYDKAYLEIEKDIYANKVFNELKGKKAFIVRLSDLQNVRID